MTCKLFNHQQKAVEKILSLGGSGALYMEVGCGKTLTALEIFKRLPAKKMLVICPISLINAAWGEDIKKFTDYSYQSLRDKKLKEADIYIINFESYVLERYQRLINTLDIDMVVIDESSKCKNHRAKITKTLLHNRDNFQYRIVMSGTPAPNDETEYWSQISFVAPHILPESFYQFRNIFFRLQRGNQVMGKAFGRAALQDAFRKGFKYTLIDKEGFLKRINPVIFWAKKKDCLDLPEQVDQIREVTLEPKQMTHYKDMKRHMVLEIEQSMVVATVALTKYMKLRQITSGFIMDDRGEALELGSNAKLNELMSVLEELGDKQVIIWCHFKKEIELVTSRLKNYVTLYGETKDRDASIEAFKSGRAQYLVAHPRSAGHGLTLVNADTMIFFSIDYSFESSEQARGRVHRPGQTNKCTYIYLIAKGTVDEDIQKALAKKEDLQKLTERIANSK